MQLSSLSDTNFLVSGSAEIRPIQGVLRSTKSEEHHCSVSIALSTVTAKDFDCVWMRGGVKIKEPGKLDVTIGRTETAIMNKILLSSEIITMLGNPSSQTLEIATTGRTTVSSTVDKEVHWMNIDSIDLHF